MNRYLVFFIPIDGKTKDDIKSTEIKTTSFKEAKEEAEKKDAVFQVIGVHLHESCYYYNKKKPNLKSINLKDKN